MKEMEESVIRRNAKIIFENLFSGRGAISLFVCLSHTRIPVTPDGFSLLKKFGVSLDPHVLPLIAFA